MGCIRIGNTGSAVPEWCDGDSLEWRFARNLQRNFPLAPSPAPRAWGGMHRMALGRRNGTLLCLSLQRGEMIVQNLRNVANLYLVMARLTDD